MTTQGGVQTQIPKLLGQNYYHWHIQMKVLLESQDLWSVVEDGVRELPNDASDALRKEHKEQNKKDKKALHYLFQASTETIFERIANAKSSKDAWEILYKSYHGERRVKTVKLQTLRCEFDILRMSETETIEGYFDRVTTIVNQLRMNEEELSDKRVVEKILRSMTRKYESVVVAVEESKDLEELSIEELMGILQSHELRLKQYDTHVIDQAF